jgi:hypothetical protein
MCHDIIHFRDSDIGKHKRKDHFDFALGEVPKGSRPSIHGGHVVEIEDFKENFERKSPSKFQKLGIRESC